MNIFEKLTFYRKLMKDYFSQRDWYMFNYYKNKIEIIERDEHKKKIDKIKNKRRTVNK